MNFGEMLREARIKKGLSLREVARRIHVSPAYLSDTEKGNKPPFPPSGKVDYDVLSDVIGVDREVLENASGRSTDDGVRELRAIIAIAKDMLFDKMNGYQKARFVGARSRGPEGLLLAVELITNRPLMSGEG